MLMIGGTVANYTKMMELTQKAKQRIDNPLAAKAADEREETPENRQIRQMREDLERSREAAIITGIETRLKSGQELSTRELEILKEKSPLLYEKAVHIARERKDYERKLNQCRTKDEVLRLNTARMQGFVGEIRTLEQSGGGKTVAMYDYVAMRMAGIRSEHIKFIKTPRYAKLPWEYELDSAKKKRKGGGSPRTRGRQALLELERVDYEMQKRLRELEELTRQEASLAEQSGAQAPGERAKGEEIAAPGAGTAANSPLAQEPPGAAKEAKPEQRTPTRRLRAKA